MKTCSSGRAAAAVMQAAEVGRGDHAAVRRRLNLSRHRRVAVKRLVCPGVVVLDVLGQNVPPVVLVQDNQVIEAFPSDRAEVRAAYSIDQK